MTQLATTHLIIAAILVLAGCGTGAGPGAHDTALPSNALAKGFEAHALPEGHPPVLQGQRVLPPGHPPMSDAQPILPDGHPALPEGHPRCPAGGMMQEEPVDERAAGWSVPAPALTST